MRDLKDPEGYHSDPKHSVERAQFFAELRQKISDLDYLLN